MEWPLIRNMLKRWRGSASSVAGETPVDIPDEMKKAKRTSLAYSSLLIVLCSANLKDEIKLFGIDAPISSVFAIVALTVVALFYAAGFYIEHSKFLHRGASSKPDAVARLDVAVDDAIGRVAKVIDVDEKTTYELQRLSEEFDRQIDEFWGQVLHRFADVKEEIRLAAQPKRPPAYDDGTFESPESMRDRAIIAKALSILEWHPIAPDNSALVKALAAIQSHIGTIPRASDRITAELRAIGSSLGRFHQDVRRFDKASIALYDILPVYALSIAGWFLACIRLSIIFMY